jgi:hypothetical protein
MSMTSLALLLTIVLVACKRAPAPPCQMPTISLRAEPVTIEPGGSVKLTWASQNATTVEIQPGIGAVAPSAAGMRQINPEKSVTYTATATSACGTAAEFYRIRVNEPAPLP